MQRRAGDVLVSALGSGLVILVVAIATQVQDPSARDQFLVQNVPLAIIAGVVIFLVWWFWPRRSASPQQGSFEAVLEKTLREGGMLNMVIKPGEKGESTVEVLGNKSDVVASGTADLTVAPPTIEAAGTVIPPSVEPEPEPTPRQRMLARIDQLTPEGYFLLDRIRAGKEEYREQAEEWLADVESFLAKYDYPKSDIEQPKSLLPFARTKRQPPWVHQLAAKLDHRLVLLRGIANRRFVRIKATLGPRSEP